jgi:hypothetical protein
MRLGGPQGRSGAENVMFSIVFNVFWQCMQPQFRCYDVTPSWLMPHKELGTFIEVCVECRNNHKRVQEPLPRYV